MTVGITYVIIGPYGYDAQPTEYLFSEAYLPTVMRLTDPSYRGEVMADELFAPQFKGLSTL